MRLLVRKTDGSTEAIEVHPPMVNAETRALFARGILHENGELRFPLNAQVVIDGRDSANAFLPRISGPVTLAKIEAAARAVVQAEADAQAERAAFAARVLSRGIRPEDGLIHKDGTVVVRDETGREFRFEPGHDVAKALAEIHADPFVRERRQKEEEERERERDRGDAQPTGGGGR